jgi:hypothetical protein
MADHRFAWLLITLAVVVRAAAVIVLQSHTIANSTYEHGTIAANLLAGRGFSTHFLGAEGPTSQQAPVYPVLVACAYALGGVETPRSLLILELGQALLGGALVAGVLALAREVKPERIRVARVAGLLVAIHPTLVYAATHVQVALLAATLLSWTLALGYRAGRTGRVEDAVATGVIFTALVLTDPILGLSSVGIAWAIVLGQESRRAIRTIAIVALSALACLAPWTVRNFLVHGEFVAVKTSFGYAFWQGNCRQSMGTDKVVRASVEGALPTNTLEPSRYNAALWKARHRAGYIDDVALTAADYRALGAVSEPNRSRILFRRALAELDAEPDRYLELSLRRLRYFVLFDETNPKTRSLFYRAPHVVLTCLACLGIVLADEASRRRLMPTLITAVSICLFHVLTIVSARFHIPVEPLMALWAACGFDKVRHALAAAALSQPRRLTTSNASSSIVAL